MRITRLTSRFKKDVKRMKKRGKMIRKSKRVIDMIALDQQLDAKYRDHALRGRYKGMRECHIEPDWLLIYKRTKSEVVLVRTGTHADLFKQ